VESHPIEEGCASQTLRVNSPASVTERILAPVTDGLLFWPMGYNHSGNVLLPPLHFQTAVKKGILHSFENRSVCETLSVREGDGSIESPALEGKNE
jgi:hypothetical protein